MPMPNTIHESIMKDDLWAVYACCATALILSGVGVIALNLWGNLGGSFREHKLNKVLWGFEPAEAAKERHRYFRFSWYKLLCAGGMGTSMLTALIAKYITVTGVVTFASVLALAWTGFLLYFWRSLASEENNEATTIGSGTSTTLMGKTRGESEKGREESAPKGWGPRQRVRGAGEAAAGSSEGISTADKRLPVTIVTGFLGAGKTTLVKRMLENKRGLKILVIENEVGDIGIDHKLLMQQTEKEDVILLNNGCICCTVRQDVIKTFHGLFSEEAFAQLDWVVIETTGLAEPAPLIQSLFADDLCRSLLRLDGVVTVVDAAHIGRHMDAYHGRGGVGAAGGMKESAHKASSSASAGGGLKGRLANLMGTGGESNKKATEPVLQIAFADRIILNKMDLVKDETAKERIRADIADINPSAGVFRTAHAQVDMEFILGIFAFNPARNEELVQQWGVGGNPGGSGGGNGSELLIERDAVTGKIKRKKLNFGAQAGRGGSSNSGGVSTVSVEVDGDLDLFAFNAFIASVLRDHGERIFRMKGILSMRGFDEQFVAHGIHMIFDGERGASWPVGEQRVSRMVFIGMGLKRSDFEEGFLAARATEDGLRGKNKDI